MKVKAKIKNLKVRFSKLPKGRKIGVVLGVILVIELLRRYYLKVSGNKEYGTVITGPGNGREGVTLMAQSKKRHILLNLTGYGFDANNPAGMSQEWVDRIEACKFGDKYYISGIRVNVRWHDLEPSDGVYDLDTVQKNIDYCRERGLSLSYCFWPFRYSNDTMIPANARITGMNGRIFNIEGAKIEGSLSSPLVKAKIYRVTQKLSEKLATYERAFYMNISTGDAEEFINPIIDTGLSTQSISDWSEVAQDAFRAWCNKRGVTFQKPNGIHHLEMNDEIGKEYARFTTQNLRDYFVNFRSAVKSVTSLPVCFMYPDCGSPQNAWALHGHLSYIAPDADLFYCTDGMNKSDTDRKRMANAVQLGTFPSAMSGIEYDPIDMGERWENGYDTAIDYDFMKEQWNLAFSEGVQIIHFGMSFSPRIHRGMENTLKDIWGKYMESDYTRPSKPVTEVDITPKFFSGDDFYYSTWNATKNHIKSVAPTFFG